MNVEVKVEGGVARIFLNRPEKSNALTSELLLQIQNSIQEIESESTLRAVVLGGHGKAFCGGADVKELAALTAANAGAFVERIHKVCAAIRAISSRRSLTFPG